MIKKALTIFCVWKITIFLLTYVASFLIPESLSFGSGKFGVGLPYFMRIWGNFDGYHYMEIAYRGYQSFEQGFFPLFPLLIHVVTSISGVPLILSGQIISNTSLILSVCMIYKILVIDKNTDLFDLIVLSMIFFPTSFYYGAVYNDSIFLLLSVMTIYFARRTNWVISGFFGAIAVLARLNGLALFFFILFEYLHGEGKNRLDGQWDLSTILKNFKAKFHFIKIFRSRIYVAILVPLSFIGYLLYIDSMLGSWKSLFSSMSVWDQDKMVFPLVVVWRYIKIVVLYPAFQLNYWVALFELSMTIFYIALLWYSFKKIRLSYWVLFALSIIIPSLTGTFQGMPRYGLHLFPLFLALSLLLSSSSRRFKIIYFSISIILLMFALTLFTRGYFVA